MAFARALGLVETQQDGDDDFLQLKAELLVPPAEDVTPVIGGHAQPTAAIQESLLVGPVAVKKPLHGQYWPVYGKDGKAVKLDVSQPATLESIHLFLDLMTWQVIVGPVVADSLRILVDGNGTCIKITGTMELALQCYYPPLDVKVLQPNLLMPM